MVRLGVRKGGRAVRWCCDRAERGRVQRAGWAGGWTRSDGRRRRGESKYSGRAVAAARQGRSRARGYLIGETTGKDETAEDV